MPNLQPIFPEKLTPAATLTLLAISTGITGGLAQLILTSRIQKASSIPTASVMTGILAISAITLLYAFTIGEKK